MLIKPVSWKIQPYGGVPSKHLGLTALILPGQSSHDLVSGIELSSVSGTPTKIVGNYGPALQLNAVQEAVYVRASPAQTSAQGSIVWAGTLTGSPTTAAGLGGTTFAATNTAPFIGIEIKRRSSAGAGDNLMMSYSYGASSGNVENLLSAGTYTTGDVVVVGVFTSGRQHLVVKSSAGVAITSNTRAGSLSYGTTPRIEIGDSLNSRNPTADCALLALSAQAWSVELAIQVACDVWGMLFAPRRILIPMSDGGGGGSVSLFPSSISSAESFGTASIVRGNVNVLVSSISSSEAFGSHVISNGTLSIVPSGIASAESFGTAEILRGVRIITPTGIASAEAFGTGSILRGTLVIYPNGIPSGELFGLPTVTGGTPSVATSVFYVRGFSSFGFRRNS